MPTRIHDAAARGFQAGATTYTQGRPDYAAATLDWLEDDLDVRTNRIVLEIGAGTGLFTRRLLETGATVIAAEPVAAMRAELRSAHRGVRVMGASAEALPLGDATVDAIVCAQSFHWFSNADALAEIRRVLKPGGRLGLIWNVRDENVSWVAELSEIMRPYEGDAPRSHSHGWQQLFPADGFTPLHERRFAHGHTGSPEQVIVNRTLSTSFIAALPDIERRQVAAQVRALIASSPDLADHSVVTYPYETIAYCCQRVD